MKYGYHYNKETNMVSKTAERSKHFLNMYNGWAVDNGVLRKYPEAAIRIVDTETGWTYTTSVQKILQEGKKVDLGFGEQTVLEVDKWNREVMVKKEIPTGEVVETPEKVVVAQQKLI